VPRVSASSSTPASTIYGPVKSWRVGWSLGVDLLFTSSYCSFRCLYCQLGRIEHPTRERRVFVPTARVLAELMASDWAKADVITLSGSGEPTLAANMGEDRSDPAATGKPMRATNATARRSPGARARAGRKVFCKLDAAHDPTLQLINRPVEGSRSPGSWRAWTSAALLLGTWHQMMFLPQTRRACALVEILTRAARRGPAQHLCAVPQGWFLGARHHDQALTRYPVAPSGAPSRGHRARARARTGLKVVSSIAPTPSQRRHPQEEPVEQP
jgi:hypothetical protein